MDPQTLARLALLSAILAVSAQGANVSTNTTTATNSTTYIVQAGDTLFSIATKFNTTIAAIQQANNLANPNAISVGQRLIIPGVVAQNIATPSPTARGPTPNETTQPTATSNVNSETATYIVRAGDTLASIAAQFGVTLAELQRINNIANPNLLTVGQRLIIPQAVNTNVVAPDGIRIVPAVVRQGETITLRVNATNVSEVLGKFDQQDLRFNKLNDEWVALIGISRCANYIGEYAVNLTLRDNLGNPSQVQFNVRVNAGTFPTQDLTLTAEMSALLDPAIMNAENALVAQTVSQYTPGQAWKGAFRSPVDIKNPRVSSQFGERRSYNGGKPGLCGHEGQDYGVAGGTSVFATAPGTIVLAQALKVRGNVVFIDHGRGVFTAFYHLKQIDVQAGQRVNTGDLIGQVGTTGFSTGDHLHWSMWVNGIYVNPLQWVGEEIP